jgi:sodium-coupled neutral amino acid transporter 11
MVAFCVIVGDTIPRVMNSLFPSLADMSFLWLLTNRRAIIIMLILGVSYPLSLYRDIAKALLSLAPTQPTLTTNSLPKPAAWLSSPWLSL